MTKLAISDLQFCRYIKGLRYLTQTRLLTYKSSIQTCTSSSPSSIPISIVIAFEMEKLLNSKLNSSGKLTRHCLLFVYLFLLPLWTDKRAFIASCGQKKSFMLYISWPLLSTFSRLAIVYNFLAQLCFMLDTFRAHQTNWNT